MNNELTKEKRDWYIERGISFIKLLSAKEMSPLSL